MMTRIARTFLFALAALPGAAFAQLTPGQWEMTSTIQQVDAGDIPPAIAAMLRKKPITVRQCITPEQAKSGPQEMLKRDSKCRFTNYSMVGGRLNATMVCNYGSTTMTATTTGTYAPTSFTGTSRQVMTGAGAPRTTVVQVAGKLTGPCR